MIVRFPDSLPTIKQVTAIKLHQYTDVTNIIKTAGSNTLRLMKVHIIFTYYIKSFCRNLLQTLKYTTKLIITFFFFDRNTENKP